MLAKQDKGDALSAIQFILGSVSARQSAKSFITETLKCKASKVKLYLLL